MTPTLAACRAAAASLVLAAVAILLLHPGAPGVRAARLPPPALPPRTPADALARAVAEDAPLPVGLASEAPSPPASEGAGIRVVQGPMEEVLYAAHPAHPAVVAQAVRLFAHKLDLTRDLALGDRVRLVLDGEILTYAELDGAHGPVRLYRVQDTGEEADAFADAAGASLRRLLLRTPLAHPRQTSGFGLRLHPMLGFTRMHQGVDFGAPVGTPVMAAGDGVVEAARWAGGYGRWVRLRHTGGYETAYAHLSAWAPGLVAGAAVRQGQVIGWTGDSGLSTGPHLHFEVIRDGQPIDPAVAGPLDAAPSPLRRAALDARRREVEGLLNGGGA